MSLKKVNTLVVGFLTGTATTILGLSKYSQKMEAEKKQRLQELLAERKNLIETLQRAEEKFEKLLSETQNVENPATHSVIEMLGINNIDWYQVTSLGSKLIFVWLGGYFCLALWRNAPSADDISSGFWLNTMEHLQTFKDKILTLTLGGEIITSMQGLDESENTLKLTKITKDGSDMVRLYFGAENRLVNVAEGLAAIKFTINQSETLKKYESLETRLRSALDEQYNQVASLRSTVESLNLQILELKGVQESTTTVDPTTLELARQAIFDY